MKRMRPISLSFSAGGFLAGYHLGAAAAFCRHGPRLLDQVQAFAGASAGSLVASVLLTAPGKIEECADFAHGLAEEIRAQPLGAFTPGYDLPARLRSGLESILPASAHQLAQGRLFVSVTNTGTWTNHLVSCFPSRDALIKVLLASSFVPLYAGLRPVEYDGQTWVDGALTDSLPVLPAGRTVTISPFSGRKDVTPQDRGPPGLSVTIAKQDIRLSVANLVRLRQALFPPDQGQRRVLQQRGFQDAVRFLQREHWFQQDPRPPRPPPGRLPPGGFPGRAAPG
ncbi:patatin-like phospholipase domain-containing protein 4 isoform X1 [Tenrec ecaudatus]|uniref:patatin-like phospholipase domain-containing protein 4 isoform X1 n=1 Tax=Tenrec ecaudatus TaxID=94439 RepID=UPI003F5995E8